MPTIEYRIQGTAKRRLSLGGLWFEVGQTVFYEMGDTDPDFVVRVAKGMGASLSDVTIMARTISDWEPMAVERAE